jgi:hypothetical protein
MKKPELGQRIRAKDRLVRVPLLEVEGESMGWIRSADQYAFSRPKPVEGIFAGTRTYTTGKATWNGEGHDWNVLERYQVWLIIYHSRRKPAAAFPEDCEVI